LSISAIRPAPPTATNPPKPSSASPWRNARFLSSKKIKFLVVACNSSSAYSLPALRKHLKIPVLGVILAGARAAARKSRGQKLGVIGTHATIKSEAYRRAHPGTQVPGPPSMCRLAPSSCP